MNKKYLGILASTFLATQIYQTSPAFAEEVKEPKKANLQILDDLLLNPYFSMDCNETPYEIILDCNQRKVVAGLELITDTNPISWSFSTEYREERGDRYVRAIIGFKKKF